MRIVGIVLIALGVIALVIQGVTYTRQREVLDIGPIEATVEQRETVPIPPIAGIIAVAAGAILLIAGRDRKTTR